MKAILAMAAAAVLAALVGPLLPGRLGAALLVAAPAWAGEGHDHGDAPSSPGSPMSRNHRNGVSEA